MRRIIVAGAGLAGLRAAQEVREQGFDGSLTIVGDESHPPYNRPPLSKQVLAGETDPQDLAFPFGDLDATWLLGHPVVGLDTDDRVLRLAGGDLPFDGLVIATGRRARMPSDLPDLKGFHVLRGLDDAIALRAAIEDHPRVVIVGAGFIGCEVAATLRQQGLEVSLVDVAAHPMAVLGPEFGQRAARLHSEHGVRLHLGTSVRSFEGSDTVEAVQLTDGTRIEADLVLLALGSVPNTEWLQGSGVPLHEGSVLCDAACFPVGHRAMVAAGDVASWPHPRVPGGPIRVEHWTNASDMARRAARNLLRPDAAVDYAPTPTFWSDQYGSKIKAVGLWSCSEEVTVVEENADNGSLVVHGHDADGMSGALLVNRNKDYIDIRRQLTTRYAAR